MAKMNGPFPAGILKTEADGGQLPHSQPQTQGSQYYTAPDLAQAQAQALHIYAPLTVDERIEILDNLFVAQKGVETYLQTVIARIEFLIEAIQKAGTDVTNRAGEAIGAIEALNLQA